MQVLNNNISGKRNDDSAKRGNGVTHEADLVADDASTRGVVELDANAGDEIHIERGRGWVHVNPSPLNPTPGSKWTASRKGVEQNFVERLRAHGIPTTIRDTRGSDIDGACGQLAAKED